MIKRGIENAAVGPLWDPIAVQICQDGGLGARLELRIGGKLGPSSGDPVDVDATVIGLTENLANALNDLDAPLGAAAGIKVHLDDEASTDPDRGIDIVLTDVRGQGFAPTIFSGVGIDPEAKKILVVKSTQHFHAGFGPISAQVLYAGDFGTLPGDMKVIPYARANTSRLWPFVENPFAASDR
jgi:microcystin degradation protein MlrC